MKCTGAIGPDISVFHNTFRSPSTNYNYFTLNVFRKNILRKVVIVPEVLRALAKASVDLLVPEYLRKFSIYSEISIRALSSPWKLSMRALYSRRGYRELSQSSTISLDDSYLKVQTTGARGSVAAGRY